MIALLVGDELANEGPLPIALAHAGFEPHPAATPDEAERDLAAHGAEDCVLVVAASSSTSGASWAAFLRSHGRVPAVVVARRTEPPAPGFEGAPHRIVLENPFDVAAVVAAARRVAKGLAAPARRVSRLREAG